MKILVTGAAGHLGAAVARDLLEAGHEVRALDIAPPPADLRGRVEIVYANISDRLEMLRAAEGCAAIAHLAAIPHPTQGNEREIMATNVVGAHYVLSAAEAHDIGRVVLASTCCVYGAPFAKNPFHFSTLPVDEGHPQTPEDLYAVSKTAGELMAAAITRRSGIATTCLRINNVINFEHPNPAWQKRWLDRAHEHRSGDLWHYIETLDVARAFRLALERVEAGHHTPILVTRDLWARLPWRELIERHYPELRRFWDCGWDFETYKFYDSRPAESLFGFVGERLWRDFPAYCE